MELIINANGSSDPISLNHNADNFKVSVVGIVSGGFNGKWTVQYSPNGVDWINHEDMFELTTTTTNNVYFQVPFIRVVVSSLSAGELKFYAYGSIM